MTRKQKFRITYDNGFEIVEAKDIFDVSDWARKTYRQHFNMPIKIELLIPALVEAVQNLEN